jgi:hypothetical protein
MSVDTDAVSVDTLAVPVFSHRAFVGVHEP